MPGVIATIPKFQFSSNGVPMVNGTVDTYLAGTTTPETTWQDQAQTTANTNPIVLDSRGEALVWLDPAKSYKFVLKNSGGVVQWTVDNIGGNRSSADLANTTDLAKGISLVGGGARQVDAITAVNATGLPDGAVIIAKGRSAAGDGGGGIFRYVAGSTQTTDSGTVFAPTAGGGRLFRDGWAAVGFSGPMKAVWFGAKGDGTTDDTTAITNALAAAKSRTATAGTAGSGYTDIELPVGVCLITSQIAIPGDAYVRFVGNGHGYYASGFLQGFAGSLFTCTAGNFVTRFYNVLFQGNKTTYVGNYSAFVTLMDSVHAGFERCVARDFGGISLSLANCFGCVFDDLILAYNKGGGLKTTGGTGNKYGTIVTQNNLGFGLDIAGSGNSGGPFFLEGDLIDNNPAGANLSNRALKISGTDNLFVGGTLNVNALNDKTPVEFAANAARNGWVAVSAAGKGTAASWVTLGLGANNCRLGGGLQSAIVGDAAAIATCTGDISGAYQVMTNGDVLFSKGSNSPAGGKGVRVGYDTANDRGRVIATEPGVANKPLDLLGSFVALRAPLGSDQTAVAATLGSVVRKLAITNESGSILGYIPIYNTIT